jgi:hypothetical protein
MWTTVNLFCDTGAALIQFIQMVSPFELSGGREGGGGNLCTAFRNDLLFGGVTTLILCSMPLTPFRGKNKWTLSGPGLPGAQCVLFRCMVNWNRGFESLSGNFFMLSFCVYGGTSVHERPCSRTIRFTNKFFEQKRLG